MARLRCNTFFFSFSALLFLLFILALSLFLSFGRLFVCLLNQLFGRVCVVFFFPFFSNTLSHLFPLENPVSFAYAFNSYKVSADNIKSSMKRSHVKICMHECVACRRQLFKLIVWLGKYTESIGARTQRLHCITNMHFKFGRSMVDRSLHQMNFATFCESWTSPLLCTW